MRKHTVLSLFGCLFLIIGFDTSAQTLKPNWTFDASARVIASPVEKDGVLFVGDENGNFYAIDAASGKQLWKVTTEGNIQSKAAIVDDNVFFESANDFYLVNRKTGKQKWKFDTKMKPFSFTYEGKTYPFKIDAFDDKHSSAVYIDGVIYVGSGNGNLYGFNAKTGEVQLRFSSDALSPIRSSPLVGDGKLYFGDWEGLVYCYDLINSALLWKKKTYSWTKPYDTFGGVVSEFVQYKGLLFFGARNFMLNVLNAETGEKEWTYTDPDRGWMIGDPVIYNDTLFLGGSDNFSMFAFHPTIGQLLWKADGRKNIYTKPVLTEQWLIYTAGNGYNWTDNGKLFVLNRKTGAEIASMETPNGIFSSPLVVDDMIYFGCYDGKVYGVQIVE